MCVACESARRRLLPEAVPRADFSAARLVDDTVRKTRILAAVYTTGAFCVGAVPWVRRIPVMTAEIAGWAFCHSKPRARRCWLRWRPDGLRPPHCAKATTRMVEKERNQLGSSGRSFMVSTP